MPRTPKRVELFKGAYSGREYPRVWTLFKSRTLKLREFFRDGAALLHVQQDTFAGTALNLLHCRKGVKFQFGRQGGAQAPSLVYTYCSSITSNGISTFGRKWLQFLTPLVLHVNVKHLTIQIMQFTIKRLMRYIEKDRCLAFVGSRATFNGISRKI